MSQERPLDGFGRALAALARGSFEARELAALSDLNRVKRPIFETEWLKLPESTRVKAVRTINELAKSSVEFAPDRVLESAIRRDPSAVVRQLAIDGSFERSDLDFAELLINLVDSDRSVDVRAAAASCLRLFNDRAASTSDASIEEAGTRIRDRLNEVLVDPDEHPLVKRSALESVAAFGSNEPVAKAIQVAFGSSDDSWRSSALIAMGRTCDRQWLGAILDALRGDDSDIRTAAAVACGRLGEEDALVSLGTVARDVDRDVRIAAIQSIGEIGGDIATNILQKLQRGCTLEESILIEAALNDAGIADAAEDDLW